MAYGVSREHQSSPTSEAGMSVAERIRTYEKKVDQVARPHIESQSSQTNQTRLPTKIRQFFEQDPETKAFEGRERLLLIDTAKEFGGHKEIRVGGGTLIVPKDHHALETAYRKIVKEIGSHIQIEETEEHKMTAMTWENTAKNPTELRAQAEHFMPEYAVMVETTAKNHQGEACFGPERCFIIKSKESLDRKVQSSINDILDSELSVTHEKAMVRATQAVNDSLRGTIVVGTPDEIRGVTEELQQKCKELGWDVTFNNIWTENFAGGYIGVHAYVLTNSRERNESVLAEIQIHLREVYDGTPHCAKEYSHHAYQYYREAYGAAPASAPSSKFDGLHEMKLARVVPPTTALDASTLVFYAHLSKVR